MDTIRIDLRTLMIMLAIGYATNALLLWAYRPRRIERSLARYMSSQILLAFSFAAFSLYDLGPGTPQWQNSLTMVAGGALSLVGMSYYVFSQLLILGPLKNSELRGMWLYTGTSIVAIFILAILRLGNMIRVMVFSMIIGIPLLYVSWRYLKSGSRSSLRSLLGWMSFIAGASFFGRLAMAFSDLPYTGFLTPVPSEIAFYLVQYLFMILAGIGMILFFKEQDDMRLIVAATRDTLTGVLNRGSFDDQAARAISLCCRNGLPFSLFIFDLDDLKKINDTMGHHAGDAALKDFARRIVATTGDGDLVGRYGGDEFVVLLQTADSAAIEALRSCLAGEVLLADGRRLPYRASGGAVVLDGACGGSPSLDEMRIACDRALYGSKSSGRGILTVHTRQSD